MSKDMLFKAQLKEVLPSAPSTDDTIIRVDHSIHPSYPDWAKGWYTPELECTGPAEYDITKFEWWFHDRQKNGKFVEGNIILTYLEETDTLKTCLGLRDLEEIQKKGVAFFRKHFQGELVFGWKSVVCIGGGDLYVPCLHEDGDEMVMDWVWLYRSWGARVPALRFAS